MSTMTRASFLVLVSCALPLAFPADAQSPSPIIVQVASALPTAPTAPAPQAAQDYRAVGEAIKVLEQMKAANQEILSKQEAALERLDEAQKAADQIKIFAHRSSG
jgi:hypothetical protein